MIVVRDFVSFHELSQLECLVNNMEVFLMKLMNNASNINLIHAVLTLVGFTLFRDKKFNSHISITFSRKRKQK